MSFNDRHEALAQLPAALQEDVALTHLVARAFHASNDQDFIVAATLVVGYRARGGQ